MAGHRLTEATIDDETALRELIGEPLQQTREKVADRLNALTRRFIELSPFVCLATSDEHGTCDVSPRGDPPGFARILDDRTPGVTDTFRVNGRATLTTDAALLAPCEVEGKLPKLGILVDIEAAYTQCSKAFLRSHLWDRRRAVRRGARGPVRAPRGVLLTRGRASLSGAWARSSP